MKTYTILYWTRNLRRQEYIDAENLELALISFIEKYDEHDIIRVTEEEDD